MPPSGSNKYGTSGSRARGFNECNRKWWFEYGPLKLVRPPGAGAILGTATHWVAENWLVKGIPPAACPPHPDPEVNAVLPKARIVFAAGVRYWPAPGKVQVEVPTSVIVGPNGEPFTGTIDVWDPKGECLNVDTWPQHGQPGWLGYNLPVVGDHKSTKSEQYIKTVAELKRDEQVISYGMRAVELSGSDVIVFQWLYYLTTGEPRAFPVRFFMTADELRAGWAFVSATAQRMLDVLPITDYRAVTPNEDMCNAYGGCHFRNRCYPPKKEITAMASTSSLFKKLDAPDAPPTQPATQPATATGINPPAQAKSGLFSKPPAVAVAPAQPAKPATPPAVAPATAPVPGLVTAQHGPAEKVAETTPVAAPVATTLPEPEIIPAAEPAKRGRPRKTPEAAAPAGRTLVVCIDCTPTKGLSARYLTEVAAPAMLAATTEAQGATPPAASYRMVKFGEGPGLLAAHFERQIEAEPIDGAILVDSRSFEGQALMPILIANAALVVQG